MYCICIVLILLTASFNVILSMLIEKSINISQAYEKGSLLSADWMSAKMQE